jgi:hypothetical protein
MEAEFKMNAKTFLSFRRDRHFWLILAHLALFFYGMALFIVGGDFSFMKKVLKPQKLKYSFQI